MHHNCQRLLLSYPRISITTQCAHFTQSRFRTTNFAHSRAYSLEFEAKGKSERESDARRLLEILQEEPWLRSVKVFRLESGLLNDPIPEQNISISEQLQQLPNLQELHLCASSTASDLDYIPFSLLSKLESLSIHHIPTSDHTYSWEIARIARALPGLKHLGLSWRIANRSIINELYQIASQFQLLHVPPLQLESLHLGASALPWTYSLRSTNFNRQFPSRDDYLHKIVDMLYLKSLRLDNFNYVNTYYLWCVPYEHITPSMLNNARNFESLTVDRLSPDIVKLIQIIQEQQTQSPGPKLDTLQVLKYGITVRSEHSEWTDNYDWDFEDCPGETIYAVPLYEIENNTKWRKLCYSGFPTSYQTPECLAMAVKQLEFVSQCTQLVELAVPIHNRKELEMLKKEVLPNLPHLQVLHLPWSMLADFLAGEVHTCPAQDQKEYRQQQEARELAQAKQRLQVVRELFEWHEQLRAQRPVMSPLMHVAIDEEAYTRLPRTAGEKCTSVQNALWTLSDGSVITRLEEEEARKVGIIDILAHYRLSGTDRVLCTLCGGARCLKVKEKYFKSW